MLNLRTSVVAGLAVTSLLCLDSGVGANGGRSRFKARFDGYQENPAISTTGRGSLTLKLDDQAREIEYTLTYSRLDGGAATASHIHLGDRHTNGGVSAFLCGGGDKPPCPPTEGSVSGVIDPADIVGPAGQGIEPGSFDELVRAMRAGVTYANVHTPRWPGGEIRGQIGGDSDDHDD